MGNNPNTSRQGESIDDCELHRSERNRYFHGKLMSARDMQAEQRYYRGLFTRHARQVTGQGVVSGLEVTLEESENEDEFDVELQPGYAVDCCGRPVVVPNEASLTVEPDDAVDEGPVWINLTYEECVRETVPVPNSEDACEQECEYNRILEVFDIRIESPDPERSPSKPVPSIEFPSKDDVEDDEDAALDTISREYESQDVPVGCPAGDGHTVFLGQYTKRGGDWVRADEDQARSRVYTNDMLYAGLARHTADYRNPHEVSLRTEQANGDALLGNEHDETDEPDVTLSSSDATLTIAVSETDQRIDLKMGDAMERLIQRRLDPLEAYFVDRVFKYTHQTFTRYLASPDEEFQPYTYGNMTESLATEIAEADAERDDELVPRIRTTAKAVIAQSSRIEFLESIDDDLAEIQELEDEFVDVAEDFVTEDSHRRLDEASGALEEAVDGLQGEGGATLSDVAAAQNAYCQAVVLLESAREEEEAVVSFARNVHRVDRGDFADITVELDGDVDDVEVTVGSEEMKYEAVLEVEPAGAEEFTITMNTFLAGNATNAQLGLGYAEPPDNETTEGVWSIDSPTGDATIREAELRTDELNAILDTGGYDLSVGFEGSVEDEAVLTVQDRVTDDHTVWTAPHTRQLREELAGAEVDTGEVLDTFEITDRDRVAVTDGERDARPRGDWAVHRIEVTGVYGALDALEIETLADLVRLEERFDVRLFAFGYEQTDPPDRPPFVLHTPNSNLEACPVFVDSDDGSLFVALDPSQIEVVLDREQAQPRPLRHELETEYEATFTVDAPYLNLFTLEDEELDPEDVSDTVAFVDRRAEFDTNDDNIIVVERAEAQEIAGETSIAPGTTVSIRARETDVAPFLMTTDVAVDAEGRFAGEFDFTEQEPEIDFTVSIPDQSFEDDAETTGHISGE